MTKPRILTQYEAWKQDNPDEGYQYDEIPNFLSDNSRGDLQSFLEWGQKTYNDGPAMFMELFAEIEHGDTEHRQWLKHKIEDFVLRKFTPNP